MTEQILRMRNITDFNIYFDGRPAEVIRSFSINIDKQTAKKKEKATQVVDGGELEL